MASPVDCLSEHLTVDSILKDKGTFYRFQEI